LNENSNLIYDRNDVNEQNPKLLDLEKIREKNRGIFSTLKNNTTREGVSEFNNSTIH